MQLSGRLVLVTGASGGIGAATAKAMARAGARVVLVARRRPALEEVAAAIAAGGGSASVHQLDLTDANAVERTARTIQRDTGLPDVLVNNAGTGRWLAVDDTSSPELEQMMAATFFGAFAMTRALLPAMRRRGSGHIVNLTSPAAFVTWPDATAYTVVRWAMRGFTEALRSDLHKSGVKVSLVTPGLVRSTYFENNAGGNESLPGVARLFRTLQPEEVARAIVRGVEREKRDVVIPSMLAAVLRLHRVFPRAVEWTVNKTAARLTGSKETRRQLPRAPG